jgi:murein DD-endopeptidase MepM/ murein hydrolase activator NlpD
MPFGIPGVPSSGAIFPLPFVPNDDYTKGGRGFGANRGSVAHAGCDLTAPAGTKVLAMYDGTVWYFGTFFLSSPTSGPDVTYLGNSELCQDAMIVGISWVTFELALVYDDGIIRYGEIAPSLPAGIGFGSKVKAGDHIAWVGQQIGGTMLHLELFDDPSRRDPLTQRGNNNYRFVPPKNYNRRDDLQDPTWMLMFSSLP